MGTTAADMIQSLKYNRSLRNRPKAFSLLKKKLNEEYERREKPDFPKFDKTTSKKVSREIKTKIRSDYHRQQIKIYSITALSFIILILGGSYFFSNLKFENTANKSISNEVEKQRLKNEQRFNYYLSDGESWLEQKHAHNALAQYNLAVTEKPENFEANLGLAKALILSCSLNQENCPTAESQIEHTLTLSKDHTKTKTEIEDFRSILVVTVRKLKD